MSRSNSAKKYIDRVKSDREAGRAGHAVAGIIPEEIQEPMRRRFRMYRVSKGLTQNGFKAIKTTSPIENHDISTLKLGVLYGLATEMGEDFIEFMKYLIGDSSTVFDPERVADEKLFRLNVLMRSLSDEDQQLVLDITRVIAGGRTNATSVERSARIAQGIDAADRVGTERNARELLQAAQMSHE